eukprot:scaffold158482_cov35-Tisochrysis_lutea.AAC.7
MRSAEARPAKPSAIGGTWHTEGCPFHGSSAKPSTCEYLFLSLRYYICIHSLREHDEMLFYHEGGVDVGDVDSKAVRYARAGLLA